MVPLSGFIRVRFCIYYLIMIRVQLIFNYIQTLKKFTFFVSVRNSFKIYHGARVAFSEDMADSFTRYVLQASRINSYTAENRKIKATLVLIARSLDTIFPHQLEMLALT